MPGSLWLISAVLTVVDGFQFDSSRPDSSLSLLQLHKSTNARGATDSSASRFEGLSYTSDRGGQGENCEWSSCETNPNEENFSPDDLQQYVKSLDLWILSTGGVGSNALVNYFASKNLVVQPDMRKYQWTCHYPSPLSETTPTLFIFGDYPRSLLSVHRQGYLGLNAHKYIYGRDDCTERTTLDRIIKRAQECDHRDPLGLFHMIHAHLQTAVFVRYPYTKESIAEALRRLKLSDRVNMDDFSFHEGSTEAAEEEKTMSADEQELIRPYYALEEIVTPLVFDYSDVPSELQQILEQNL